MSKFNDASKTQPMEEYKVLHEDSIGQLQDIFPDWSVDDLAMVLSELGGDIERVIQRISEGFVMPWSKSGKKLIKKENSSSKAIKASFRNSLNRSDKARAERKNEKTLGPDSIEPAATSNAQREKDSAKKISAGRKHVRTAEPKSESVFLEQKESTAPSNAPKLSLGWNIVAAQTPPSSSMALDDEGEKEVSVPAAINTNQETIPQSDPILESAGTEKKSTASRLTPKAIYYKSTKPQEPKALEKEVPSESPQTIEDEVSNKVPDLAIVEPYPQIENAPPVEVMAEVKQSFISRFEAMPIVDMPKGLSCRFAPALTQRPVVILPIKANVRPGMAVTFGGEAPNATTQQSDNRLTTSGNLSPASHYTSTGVETLFTSSPRIDSQVETGHRRNGGHGSAPQRPAPQNNRDAPYTTSPPGLMSADMLGGGASSNMRSNAGYQSVSYANTYEENRENLMANAYYQNSSRSSYHQQRSNHGSPSMGHSYKVNASENNNSQAYYSGQGVRSQQPFSSWNTYPTVQNQIASANYYQDSSFGQQNMYPEGAYGHQQQYRYPQSFTGNQGMNAYIPNQHSYYNSDQLQNQQIQSSNRSLPRGNYQSGSFPDHSKDMS